MKYTRDSPMGNRAKCSTWRAFVSMCTFFPTLLSTVQPKAFYFSWKINTKSIYFPVSDSDMRLTTHLSSNNAKNSYFSFQSLRILKRQHFVIYLFSKQIEMNPLHLTRTVIHLILIQILIQFTDKQTSPRIIKIKRLSIRFFVIDFGSSSSLLMQNIELDRRVICFFVMLNRMNRWRFFFLLTMKAIKCNDNNKKNIASNRATSVAFI